MAQRIHSRLLTKRAGRVPLGCTRRRRHERAHGQVLLVFALMATLLVGFCGLALDAAESHFNQRTLQETADAAALTAAYKIYAGTTEAVATTAATQVATDDGCTSSVSCTLSLTYQDSGGATTAAASSVDRVVASLSQPHTNKFIQIVGTISTNTIQTTATAKVRNGTAAPGNLPCGLCLLQPGNDLIGTHSGVTISVTSGDIDVNGSVSLSGNSSNITVSNGGKFNVTSTSNSFGSWTISPAATTGVTAIADPLASLGTPSATTQQGANVSANNQTISPGIYGKLSTQGTVTFSPGVYVFVGGNGSGIINSSNGTTLTGSGVTLYFACGTYPTPTACSSGGQVGSGINAAGSLTMNLSAPTSGTWNNMLIYYDRLNTSPIKFNQTVSGTNTGAVYAADSQIIITNSGTFTLGSPIVAGALNITCCGMTFGSSAGVGSGSSTGPGNLWN